MFPMTMSNRAMVNAMNGLLYAGQRDRLEAIVKHGLTARVRRNARFALAAWDAS